ncbi:MAG: CNNM domain-containing protein, partial [Pseudomonas sp.]
MDNLPLGPMLAVVALLVLWSALFTAIEAAQQHLLALRPGTRQGDKAAARLNFPRNSLILCNTLCRAVVVILCTLLAIYAWAQNGPWLGWVISSAVLLVLADYLPRALATRHPQTILGFGNTLLSVPLKILYPLAWLLNGVSLLL